MPSASRTINKKQLTRNNVHGGFSLVEILLSLFFIIAIVTILFSTSGSLLTRRRSDLQSIAAKIATKHVETLRAANFADLQTVADSTPSGAPYGNCTLASPCTDFNDTDISKLPNGKPTRTIILYEGAAQIKQITVAVYWQEGNKDQQNITMDTLIYENGL